MIPLSYVTIATQEGPSSGGPFLDCLLMLRLDWEVPFWYNLLEATERLTHLPGILEPGASHHGEDERVRLELPVC